MHVEFFRDKSSNIGAFTNFLRSPKNKNYLDYLKESLPEHICYRAIPEMLYYFLSDEKPSVLCRCGSNLKFIGFKNGYRKTCGKRMCVSQSTESTNLKNWGVTNPMKSIEILDKVKKTIDEKWEGRSPMSHERVKQKWRSSVIKNLGVTSPQKNKIVRKKSIDTWISNPNREQIITKRNNLLRSKTDQEKQDIEYKRRDTIARKYGSYENFLFSRLEKIKERSKEKWNIDHHLKSPEIIKKRIDSYKKGKNEKIKSLLPHNLNLISSRQNENHTDTYIFLKCTNCSSVFEITRQLLYHKCEKNINPCLICNPDAHGSSRIEKELLVFIESIYQGKIISRYKLDGKELDIFLPEINLGFELNGLWWHSELFKQKNFHRDKSIFFDQRGVNIYHIWEDDWLFKREIVESIIRHKLKITPHKLGAKFCSVKELPTKDAVAFLVKNSIDFCPNFTFCLSLYHDQEIVAIMCFKENELLNFCTKLSFAVYGAFSKLLKCFSRKFKYDQIISHSNNAMFSGSSFRVLNFSLEELLDPQYFFIKNGRRNLNYGSLRISDCGKKKWTLSRIH